ncbi:putative seryl-tRNA synthetase [Acinetobacter phage vB_AbaM_CP14]|nr:putative seryl-tRNA synthetase [Acinetobacter phage vB_AbaM_CP14]
MENLIKADFLEEGNFLLMCYQDVLKALEGIKMGIYPPHWFSLSSGTCINTELVAQLSYGVNEVKYNRLQRSCVNELHPMVKGESKLDYVLNQAWIEFVKDMGNTVGYVDVNSSKVYPIFSEYSDCTPAYSYANSVAYKGLYKDKQLEARICLVNFKCVILKQELSNIWKAGTTTEGLRKIFED